VHASFSGLYPARGYVAGALDQAAPIVLAQLLTRHGPSTHVEPFSDVRSVAVGPEVRDAPLMCVSYFEAATQPPPGFQLLVRRVRRLTRGAQIPALLLDAR
jgi:hypothetical protein